MQQNNSADQLTDQVKSQLKAGFFMCSFLSEKI